MFILVQGERNCGCPNFINFDFVDFREYSPVHYYIKRSLEPKMTIFFLMQTLSVHSFAVLCLGMIVSLDF